MCAVMTLHVRIVLIATWIVHCLQRPWYLVQCMHVNCLTCTKSLQLNIYELVDMADMADMIQ